MKNFLILFGLGFFIFFIAWNGGYWFGHEKAIAEIQTEELQIPIPLSEMVAGSSANMYHNYILKECLVKVKELEALR